MTLVALLLLACGETPEENPPPAEAAPEAPRLQVGTVGGEPVGRADEDAVITAADCDTVTSEPLASDACITGKLSCGDTVVGHTVGGTNRFDTRFYEQFFCTPATTDHNDGGERVYQLELPDGDHHATVTLDTPCADLDLAVIRWEHEGCPDKSSRVDGCEMNRAGGKKRERARVASRSASKWLVVVEGEGAHEGAFGLKVECAPGL